MLKWKHKNKKGQSTIEYVLLVTAVIMVVLLFIMGENSPFRRHLVNETLAPVTNSMFSLATTYAGSHSSAPAAVSTGDSGLTDGKDTQGTLTATVP